MRNRCAILSARGHETQTPRRQASELPPRHSAVAPRAAPDFPTGGQPFHRRDNDATDRRPPPWCHSTQRDQTSPVRSRHRWPRVDHELCSSLRALLGTYEAKGRRSGILPQGYVPTSAAEFTHCSLLHGRDSADPAAEEGRPYRLIPSLHPCCVKPSFEAEAPEDLPNRRGVMQAQAGAGRAPIWSRVEGPTSLAGVETSKRRRWQDQITPAGTALAGAFR